MQELELHLGTLLLTFCGAPPNWSHGATRLLVTWTPASGGQQMRRLLPGLSAATCTGQCAAELKNEIYSGF